MAEVAINVPFTSAEIKDITCAELRKRLDQLSPLMGAKEYASFHVEFNVKVRVLRPGDTGAGKETLAWGHTGAVIPSRDALNQQAEDAAIEGDKFDSGDPNTERMERGMEMTVESPDGKGGKQRRKVRIEA